MSASRVSWLCILGLCVILSVTPSAFGYSNIPGLEGARVFDTTTVHVGESATAVLTFTNVLGDDVRGFSFSDQIPQEVADLTTISVAVNDVPVTDYTFSAGVADEIYDGMVPYRWSLETPPEFPEEHPVPGDAGVVTITYQFSFDATGTYELPLYLWTGLTETSDSPAFGYGDSVDTLRVIPSSSTGDGDLGVGRVLTLKLYPNPGSGLPTVRFSSGPGSVVDLSVYDVSGRLLGRVFTGMAPDGELTLTPMDVLQRLPQLPSGTCFWVLKRGDERKVCRFVLLEE